MTCNHELEVEHLYPGDTDILEIYEAEGEVHVKLALPCPECGTALELDASIDSVEEGDFQLPLSDELYD